MDTSIDIVYAEVYEILKGISKEKVALIPKDIILKIKENRSKNYQVEIDWSKDLEENNFSKDTINILGYFNYAYWANGSVEKERLKQIYSKNIKEKMKRLGITEEKVIPNDNNSIENKDIVLEELSLVEKEENGMSNKGVKTIIKTFLNRIFK